MRWKSLVVAAAAALAAAGSFETQAQAQGPASYRQLPVNNPDYMHDKYKPGDAYDPNRFVDPAGYQQKIELYEKRYRAQLEKDRKAN